MKRIRLDHGFFLCLLLNLVLNWEWSVPAWILLVLHFVLDWSIWWFVGALVLWILGILLFMAVMGWASRCGDARDPEKKNKNPYSKTSFPGTSDDGR